MGEQKNTNLKWLSEEVERMKEMVMSEPNPIVIIDPGTGKPLIIDGVVQEDVLKEAVEGKRCNYWKD